MLLGHVSIGPHAWWKNSRYRLLILGQPVPVRLLLGRGRRGREEWAKKINSVDGPGGCGRLCSRRAVALGVGAASNSRHGADLRRHAGHCNDMSGQRAMAAASLHHVAPGPSGQSQCRRPLPPDSGEF